MATFEKHVLLQPAPCIIFRGQGNVKQPELDAYPEGLVVLWQKCAWVDRPTALDWVRQVIKPFMAAQRAAGVADESTHYLLFEDNLDAQSTPEYIDFLSDECATDDQKVPPNETDQVQPIDRGIGRLIKQYLGQELGAWLEDDENMEN